MTRSEARMIAEELHSIIRRDIERCVAAVAVTAADRQLSSVEAAAFLGIRPSTLYNNIGSIPHYKVGKHLRFSQNALAAYIDTRPSFSNFAPKN
ncbi:MAG: helix-turn-helix domain-containing protein [Roseburia sp.]|nr:helix-turn-helix domain-containing protein [Roseburia sp.]